MVYSTTKHIDGQGRCLGGVILGLGEVHQRQRPQLHPADRPLDVAVQRLGDAEGPGDAGGARCARRPTTAAKVADALAEHPKLSRLIYPGRPDHPQAAVVKKQMRGGSTLVAFEVASGKKGAFAFQDALKIVRISNNLGDAKSLITHPATTTHQRLKPEQRADLGISDGMVRLSCGLEHVDDLIEDVTNALKAV